MSTHLLVVLLDGATPEKLDSATSLSGGEPPSVYILAPAHVDALHWLASDEDQAHASAASRVLGAEWMLGATAEIGGEPGESDPALAVADALVHFPADEIVVVGDGTIDPQLHRALGEFGLPVTLWGVTVGPDTLRSRLRAARRGLGSGRTTATPFVAFLAANLGLLLIGLLAALIVGIVLWVIQAT